MRAAGVAEAAVWAGDPDARDADADADADADERLVVFRSTPPHAIPLSGEDAPDTSPDDLQQKEPLDHTRIDLGDVLEVRWWCEELACTESRLRHAISAVGVLPDDIIRHLRR